MLNRSPEAMNRAIANLDPFQRTSPLHTAARIGRLAALQPGGGVAERDFACYEAGCEALVAVCDPPIHLARRHPMLGRKGCYYLNLDPYSDHYDTCEVSA